VIDLSSEEWTVHVYCDHTTRGSTFSPFSDRTHACWSPKCKLERTNALNYWAMKHRTPFDSQTGAARRSHSLFEDVAQNSIQRNASGLLNLSETWRGGDSKRSGKIYLYLPGSTTILMLSIEIGFSRHYFFIHSLQLSWLRLGLYAMDTTDFQSHNFLEFYGKHFVLKISGEWMHTAGFLDLSTSCRCVVSFTPRPFLTTGNIPWYPLDRRVIGPRSLCGWYGE
jgi:hypothetical protein